MSNAYSCILDEWNKLEQAIRQLTTTNPQHRFFMRTLPERATECQLDGQSRITIPKELLEFASIENGQEEPACLDCFSRGE